MTNDRRLRELAALVTEYSDGDGVHATAVHGLQCFRMSAPSAKMPALYNPSLCVVVQGSKQVFLEGEVYRYAPSQFLVVSVDLPVLGQIVQASAEKPYLCVQIEIDPHQLSDIMAQSTRRHTLTSDTARALFVGDLDEPMLDAVSRLVRLLRTPKDIPVLAPMVIREIHYRMLEGEYGYAITQMAATGSNTHKIAQAIRKMKSDLAHPVRVEALAAMVHMSTSSFHQHFKAVTAMSPLQYHKRLRLTQARQIMLSENVNASGTAYRVGYESASQFSREYARMFGAPPMRDIEALRDSMRSVAAPGP